MNSQVFLFVFLPALVFHGALSIDVRRLARDIAPVLLLAVVAVVATTAAVGFALQPIAGQTLMVCLLLGAIVATTDPSAVIGVFRDIGADARLTRLVEGESLLNDAAAIALFTLLLATVTHRGVPDLGTAGLMLAGSLLGGAAVGYALARLALAAMPLLAGSRLAEVTLTLALPYVSYIVCDEYLGVSGVVAAAAAGLTVSAIGPSVLRPPSWSFLVDVWAQTAFLATSLVFVLASMLVPRLMLGLNAWDLLLVGVAVLAALAARAAVLFLVMPLLRLTRIAQRMPGKFKLTMLWGGLRGSITLAMALAVTENRRVPAEVQQFIAILATGFVLFTLLVNGTTLRFLVRWLKLDRLSPIDQALRHQVLALGLGQVRDRLRQTADEFGFLPQVTQRALELYDHRAAAAAAANTFDAALTDRDRVKLGLLTFAAQERAILLEIFRERGAPRRIMAKLLRTADVIIDATRADGRLGYLRAVRAAAAAEPAAAAGPLGAPPPRHRLAAGRDDGAALRNAAGDATGVPGADAVHARPDDAGARRARDRRAGRDRAAPRASAQRRDGSAGAALSRPCRRPCKPRCCSRSGCASKWTPTPNCAAKALLSKELFKSIGRDIETRRNALRQPITIDLQTGLRRLLSELPPFAALPEDLRRDIARRLTIVLAMPGERILRAAAAGGLGVSDQLRRGGCCV